MSLHIEAKKGEIADTILLPGDPLRAKFVADNFLEDAVCYNRVRNIFGYTGTYKGKKISVQGTGMGIPSMSIYVTELIKDYGVKNLIRIGSCGAIKPEINLRDVILAEGASTDSQTNKLVFNGADFAAIANFELLLKAYNVVKEKKMNVHVGNVLSSDIFYSDDPDFWKIWAKYGILGIDMEATALYSIAAKYGVKALTILTVSDQINRGEAASSEERQTGFSKMIEIALETVSK
ncbi:MAG: purine-nucleoside phosphorylase [Candidatus Cloacimonetes bacterium]|mgnify:CR=1 FL=1|jgi:purine-nucleoside phosphorylase|nr:purine-nucleoside phosphorylase [Candidatus Cloacimonadota bacterium]MBT4332478.1 purine-nucleoside phosphorylase [Candidatus Cloacimonadota bacterium]MBT4576067.1 purine-nucleoside phosphorylase [Candidatus Cloacimonadota bacterium]